MCPRSRLGAVHIITGNTQLNADGAESLTAAVEQCCGEGPPRIVLDMTEIPLLDSVGLESLLAVQERVEARAGTVKLAAPNALCRDILNVTGLAHNFDIHREVKSAVGSFLH